MADSTYGERGELGDRTGGRSPRPVRRSKHYEDLVLKQLRKTSRQFCLETAYACDRQNVNYRCGVEITQRQIGQNECNQINSTKSASSLSEKTRVFRSDAENITDVGAAPDFMADVGSVKKTRHSLGNERVCSFSASPSPSESHVPLVTSAERHRYPSPQDDRLRQTRTAHQLRSPAVASSQTKMVPNAPDYQCPSECETAMSGSDGLKCGAVTHPTTSHTRGTQQPGGFATEYCRRSDSIASAQESQESQNHEENLAGLSNGEATNISDDASSYKPRHVIDKCTAVVVQRELHITEVLRHRSVLDDQQKSEISCSDYHSSDEELLGECESPKGNEDGSDSGTGIEVYRPDNPSVLRKKIDDLEGQIQDLQEANVATYAEVLRLQQENDVLRQHNDGSRAQLSSSTRSYGCERHERSSSRGTSRSLLSSSVSVSSSSSSKPSNMLDSCGSAIHWSKEALCAGQERLQKVEISAVEQREEYPVSLPAPSVAGSHAYGTSRDEAELTCDTHAATRTPPYSLRPTRLNFDDDEDGDSCRRRMTVSPLGYTVSSTFAQELDVSKLWISSSDASIGLGISRSPSTATRALVPRTPADIYLGDAVKYTQRDGRVGRGYVKHVGWCNERKRMCVAVTSNTPDWLQPPTGSPPARREGDEIVPFEKVLLIWKKGMIRD